MTVFRLVLVTALLLMATHAQGEDKGKQPLKIQLSTHIASVPVKVTVRLRVAPDPKARAVHLEWFNADGAGGAHFIQLDGERSRIAHQVAVNVVEPGEYEVLAVLQRNDGTLERRTARMIVIGETEMIDSATMSRIQGLAERD
jgi:hypothetical protein